MSDQENPKPEGTQPADAQAENKPAENAENNKDKKDGEGGLSLPAPKLPFGGEEENDDDFLSASTTDMLEPCCCCHCVCSNNKTQDLACFGCFPIKCGLVLIGAFTIALAAWQISYNFFLILNDLVEWWYPVITIALLVPLYIAAAFFVNWFTKDELSSRSKLPAACILTLISLSLVAVWNVIYFVWIYKKDTVYIGWGGPGEYKKFQKKFYIFVVLLDTVILVTLYTYFLCVAQNYKNALRKENPNGPSAKKAAENPEKK